MKPTPSRQLLRPWKTYADGTIFYGSSKQGNKRYPLTTKQGNKNFYKGTGASKGIGSHTSVGRYIINWSKVRTFVVPSNLNQTTLKPFVCETTPPVKNTFKGFTGPTDGRLYIKKLQEYVEEGAFKKAREGLVERG